MSQSMSPALTTCSATELAQLIARGEVSAAEAVEAHIERIEQVNPQINAVVVTRYAAARAEAQAADQARRSGTLAGPLHGVPITIKECLDLQDTPSTLGLPNRVHDRASADDPYVARLRQAGAIVLGKTNVPQLLIYYESCNPVYGRTKNPWDFSRASGGSSGGEAAIIAAHGAPLGLGTDIGGSLRVPAHFCGIVSLKPTAPRTLDWTRMSEPRSYGPIVSLAGPMARDVADVELALSLIGDVPNQFAPQPMPLGGSRTVDLSTLHVGYYTDDGTFTPSPAIKRAVREAAELLGAAGAQVQPWQPPAAPEAVDLYYRILTSDGGALVRTLLGADRPEREIAALVWLAPRPRRMLALLERTLRLAGQRSLATTVRALGYPAQTHLPAMERALAQYRARFAAAMDQTDGGPLDLILCPTCALPAYTHGASAQLGVSGGYAVLYNVLGYPAGNVPITRVRPNEEIGRTASLDLVQRAARAVEQGSAGLPVGVQVAARPWQEHLALAAMRALQDAARAQPDYPQLSVVNQAQSDR
jgi:fatty acid amide hydrolase